jgi:predicted HAD superfamily Cof-like phosphohydrolase
MNFFHRVFKFNTDFGLAHPAKPTFTPELRARLVRFKEIITDEVNEVDDIIDKIDAGAPPIEVLTDLSDWLGDMIVYAASEMIKHGLPPEMVLHTIMDSNDSKFDENGKPIIVNGKVQKGPNYLRPEPKIKATLEVLS